jgi:hypothetical protein
MTFAEAFKAYDAAFGPDDIAKLFPLLRGMPPEKEFIALVERCLAEGKPMTCYVDPPKIPKGAMI